MDHRDDLGVVDNDFVHLFSSWFNRGFLVLRRIHWSTSAAVLEKIIRYEAVHEISDWADLRRRIDCRIARCYGSFDRIALSERIGAMAGGIARVSATSTKISGSSTSAG